MAPSPAPLLEAADLAVHFPVRRGLLRRQVDTVRAVDGVSLAVRPGETLALVGESGCGKTTTGKALLKLIPPTGGAIRFEGTDITHLDAPRMVPLRRKMQIVFQDPFASLNPRQTIGAILAAPFDIHGIGEKSDRKDRVARLLRMVGLPTEAAARYPHEFSGGQRQRIGIARALALEPKLVVGDEPVSALDVSIQAQIVNLMKRLQADFRLAYLFISHNLGVVAHISDRVAVMYLGRIVEQGTREEIFFGARHPYTQALLAAVPEPVPGRRRAAAPLGGDVPSPANPPAGCRFHPRCPVAIAACRTEVPAARRVSDTHEVACHLVAAA